MNDAMDTLPAAPVPALVLAGGDPSDELARAVGAPAKALVPLKGRPLGAYVLDALMAARSVGSVVWVGALDAAMERRVDTVVEGGPRLVDSLTLGLGAVSATTSAERVLVATADVPWIDGATVDRLLAAAATDADVVYPVVSRDVYDRTFADLPRTWLRIGGDQLTGGNLVVARPSALRTLLPWIDLATRDRKAPVRLAARLGLGTLFGLATGTSTLARLEERASRLLGLTVRALVSEDASLVCDVDRPDHLPATLSLGSPAPRESSPA